MRQTDGCVCAAAGLPEGMEAFNVLLGGPVSDYLNHSRAIGSEVEKHVSAYP